MVAAISRAWLEDRTGNMPPAEGAPAAALPLHMRCGKLAAALRHTDARVRPVSSLLPLPLCIAICLTAHAVDDRPLDSLLCPAGEAVRVFADGTAPTSTPGERGLPGRKRSVW